MFFHNSTMVTRKSFGKHVGKALKSIVKAKPEAVGKYVERGMNNLAQGGAALAGAAGSLATGDVKGAATGARTAVNKVVGKNNVKGLGQVVLGKKAASGVSKGIKKINRADSAFEKLKAGDVMGATKTAIGKKAYDKVNKKLDQMNSAMSAPSSHSSKLDHHIARAKHHADQVQAIHSAVTGRLPQPVGGMRTY